MGKIYCLFGKSSSGKDTLFKMLLKKEELGLKTIIPYTTRPIRAGETEGVEYHFVTEQEAEALAQAGKIIEQRAYHTVHGIWKYFTVDDAQLALEKNNYLMIGTLESYVRIRNYFGHDKLIPIYIAVEDGMRLARALERERKQQTPKYAELCRRFLADEADFSEEKLRDAGVERYFINQNLKDTCEEITAYICGNIKG